MKTDSVTTAVVPLVALTFAAVIAAIGLIDDPPKGGERAPILIAVEFIPEGTRWSEVLDADMLGSGQPVRYGLPVRRPDNPLSVDPSYLRTRVTTRDIYPGQAIEMTDVGQPRQ